MSEISKRIHGIYNTVQEDEPRRPIKPETVEEALKVLKDYRVRDAKGLFFYLAAINLLNAAIKMKEYKTDEFRSKNLTYFFIKGKARAIVEYVIAKRTFESVSYYFNAAENCLYVKVYDIVFSFHSIDETFFIRNVAAKQTPFVWPGIRLQWIAEDVFLLGKEFLYS